MPDPTGALYTPADPALIEAVKKPEPTLTEDPAKIAALNRQAAAMEASAQGIKSMAGLDAEPYPAHDVYLRARLAAVQAGQYTTEGAGDGVARAVVRDYQAFVAALP